MDSLTEELNKLENDIIEFKTRQQIGSNALKVYEWSADFEASTKLMKNGIIHFDYQGGKISPIISVYFVGTVEGVDFNTPNNYGSVEYGEFMYSYKIDLAELKDYNRAMLQLSNKTVSNGIATELRNYKGTIYIRTSVPITNVRLEWLN